MVVAFVLIMAKAGKEKEVVKAISKFSEVVEVQLVYGDYDIVAKVDAKDLDTLNNVVISKIRKLPNISVTSTLLAI